MQAAAFEAYARSIRAEARFRGLLAKMEQSLGVATVLALTGDLQTIQWLTMAALPADWE